MKLKMMKNKIIILLYFCFLYSINQHTDRIIDLVMSNDKSMYVSAGKDNQVIIWNSNDNKIINYYKFDASRLGISQVALSYNNKLLCVGFKDGTIDIINIDSNKSKSLFNRDNNKINLLKFIKNKYLVSYKDLDKSIKFWDYENMDFLYDFTPSESKITNAIINSNQNNILLQLSSKRFSRLDLENVQEIVYSNAATGHKSYKEEISLIDFNADRSKILDSPSSSIWKYKPIDYYKYDISPDGSKIAIITNENNAIIWNSNFYEDEIKLNANCKRVNDIEFSNNGQFFAIATIDKKVKVWNIYNRKLVLEKTIPNNWVTKLIFDNNQIICGTFTGEIIILSLD